MAVVFAHQTQALVFLISRVWVRVPLDTRVLEQDTYCFVIWIGCKAVGPLCCVMHINKHSYT